MWTPCSMGRRFTKASTTKTGMRKTYARRLRETSRQNPRNALLSTRTGARAVELAMARSLVVECYQVGRRRVGTFRPRDARIKTGIHEIPTWDLALRNLNRVLLQPLNHRI